MVLVAARPGRRQLVHLADIWHSGKRRLAQKAEKAVFASSRRILLRSDEESKKVDTEEQYIAELKSRRMFGSASTNACVVPSKNLAYLFGKVQLVLSWMKLSCHLYESRYITENPGLSA